MNVLWWFVAAVGIIAVGVVAFYAIPGFILFIFAPHLVMPFFVSKAKRAEWRQEAEAIARKFNMPAPPELSCEVCGNKLTYSYIRVYHDGYDPVSGLPRDCVIVQYFCPQGHFAGAPQNGKRYCSHWGSNSSWSWAL